MSVPESVECQLVTWEEACLLSRALAKKVISSGFVPDVVVAIARGGFVPARIVCDRMLIGMLTSLKAEHWGIAAVREGRAAIRIPLSIDVSGMKILVVDDVTDTGETMEVILEYLQAQSPAEVRVGVLHHKKTSRFVPDFCADVQPAWRWIIYPWALHEDLTGFVHRILVDGRATRAGLVQAIERRYRFCAPEDALDEALEALLSCGAIVAEGGMFRCN